MAGKKFDEMMERLEEVVQGLEDGELSLEESIESFEEGMKLVNSCSKKLEEAEQKVNLLVKKSGDEHIEQPFELKETGKPEDGS